MQESTPVDGWLVKVGAGEEPVDDRLAARLKHLLRQLQRRGDERRVAHEALVLVAVEHPSAPDHLLRFFEWIDLDHPHWPVYEVLFPLGEVLGELANSRPALAASLLDHVAGPLENGRRQAAAIGIGKRLRHPTNAVVAVAVARLEHESWLVRQAAIEVLSHLEEPDGAMVRGLVARVADSNRTVRGAARSILKDVLRVHPRLLAGLPPVFHSNLEQDLVAWYGWEASSLDNAVPGLIRQPPPLGQKFLAAIYAGDPDVRDVAIRLLARWEVEGDDERPITALLARWLDHLSRGPFPALAAAERLSTLIGNPILPIGTLLEQGERDG